MFLEVLTLYLKSAGNNSYENLLYIALLCTVIKLYFIPPPLPFTVLFFLRNGYNFRLCQTKNVSKTS